MKSSAAEYYERPYDKRMKHMSRISILVIALLVATLPGGTASAATLSVSREIHVTARVLPKRTVIINYAGQITEIASNTEDDVTPDVYLIKPSPDSKRSLTPEIMKQYRTHVPKGTNKYGILYKQNSPYLQPNFAAIRR